MNTMSPIFLSILIMAVSLLTTVLIFKSTITSWIAFVTILTFSSGMMTLFMYTASLSPNEKSKSKKSLLVVTLLMLVFVTSNVERSNYLQTMKNFSTMMMILIMGAILIITLLALSLHGHHPNQTISSSF